MPSPSTSPLATPHVVSVSARAGHAFSKSVLGEIELIAGLGVAGDAHCGETVKHRSRVAVDPTQPNLRQVHLIAGELLDELATQGFTVRPGDLGENILTHGVDLLGLPRGAVIGLGPTARVEITGLRNPCGQIEAFQTGLLSAVLTRDAEGGLVRKAGIMGIVLVGGVVRPGDTITVTLPALPHQKLERV
jgi:MOSC domain